MKSSASKIKLTPVDELFTTDESRADDQREKIVEIPLVDLHPFKDHPFKVVNDEKMQDTAESIREYGVLVPAIVRPRDEGGYEIVSGHRRHFASQLAGLDTMPAIIRDLDDDAATIIMVDANLQRESILPSERAFAYRMKLEAINRMKGRPKKVGQVVPNYFGKRSTEIVAEGTGESYKQVQRFIRLTELVPALLEMVDTKEVGFNPAVELSYLKPKEQIDLLDAMESEVSKPSLGQAQRLKRLSQEGNLTIDKMRSIMSEEKKSIPDRTTNGNNGGERSIDVKSVVEKPTAEKSIAAQLMDSTPAQNKPASDKGLIFDESELNSMFPKAFPPEKRKPLIKQLVAKWLRSRAKEAER